jgi:hypothetical protein
MPVLLLEPLRTSLTLMEAATATIHVRAPSRDHQHHDNNNAKKLRAQKTRPLDACNTNVKNDFFEAYRYVFSCLLEPGPLPSLPNPQPKFCLNKTRRPPHPRVACASQPQSVSTQCMHAIFLSPPFAFPFC